MIPERETPNSPPRPEFCLFASETLSARIWAMLDEIQGVRESRDPECLHRMRVASRRFRNALSLFRECFSPAESKRWQKEARAVGRALGEARDADVQAASVEERMEALTEPRLKPGVERLLLRLSQKRSSLQGKVHKALERLETGPLKGELPEALRSLSVETRLACPGETAPVVRSAASVLLARRLAELEAFDAVADHPERVEELHSMRITAKRLRYTLEVFRAVLGEQAAAVLGQLKEMQDLLGEIHDCDVWTAWLPVFMEEERSRTLRYFGHLRAFARLRPGIEFLEGDYRDRRKQRFLGFRGFWKKKHSARGWMDSLSVPEDERS